MPRGRKAKIDATAKPEPLADDLSPTAKKSSTRKVKAGKKDEKAMTESIILQSAGIACDVNEVKERVIAAYVAAGHRRGRISKLEIYLKPEDRKAYYVINAKTTGSIDIM